MTDSLNYEAISLEPIEFQPPSSGPIPSIDLLDCRIRDSALPPLDFPSLAFADSPPENHGQHLNRSSLMGRALLYSLLIHLFIALLIFWGVHQREKRPIKEAAYWVVNLLPMFNAEPKGPKVDSPQDQILDTRPIAPRPHAEMPTSPKRELFSDENVAPGPEIQISSSSSQVGDDASMGKPNENDSLPPVEAAKQLDPTLQEVGAPVSQQVQMGQYILRMKMNDPMLVMKLKFFQQNLKSQLEGLIRTSVAEEVLKALDGRTTTIKVLYLEDGGIQEVSFDPDSDGDLTQILKEKIEWNTLASPKKFGLPFKGIRLYFVVNTKGQINVNLVSL